MTNTAAVAAAAAALPAGQGWRQAGELGLALLLSTCIGAAREIRRKNAGLRTPARPRQPSGTVTSSLCRRPDDLTGDERPKLKAIMDRCPELHAAPGQVRAFAAMITNLTGQHLPQWTAAARDAGLPGIASFAKGLEHDLDAVTNALTMSWSPGPAEGRVNHIILWNQSCQIAPEGLHATRSRVPEREGRTRVRRTRERTKREEVHTLRP
jgi:hypothetical protein